jgi:PAS domain S-box-containing protein
MLSFMAVVAQLSPNEYIGPMPVDIHRAIVEQAQEGIIFIDCDNVVRLWNRGAEKLFGYTAEEALGRSIDIIIPERFRPGHAEGLRRAVEAGKTRLGGRVMTTRATHKSGSKIYVDLSFGLVKDGDAVLGAFAVARDCTARFQEEAARRAQAAAAASAPSKPMQ